MISGNRRLVLAVSAFVIALVGVVVSAVVLLPQDQPAKKPVAARATASPSPGPAVTSTPVPAPTPSLTVTIVVYPPQPPVDTSRAVPAGETTLLEMDTGRVLRWESGENVQNPRFSPDSRWLVYNQGWVPGENDLANSRIYRIDLTAPELTPQMIAVGFNPSISSRGDIAFNRQIDGQRANVYVALTHGSIRQLSGIGATFTAPSWSPDGRWLVFASGYIGEGINMPITLVDTTTWTERVVGMFPPKGGDVVFQAGWSPDSRHFIYSGQVFSTAAGTVIATGARQWIDETHYLAIEDDPQTRRMVAAYSVDLTTGATTELFRPEGSGYASWNLEREVLIYHIQPDPLGNAPPFYRLTTFEGSTVIDRLPGSELLSTPGMLFLATKTQDGDGCRGVSVYDRSGKPLRCLSAFNVVRGPGATFAYQVVVRPGNFETRMNTVDVYLYDASEGSDTLLLTGLLDTCLRFSPDNRWLVADDFCDTM